MKNSRLYSFSARIRRHFYLHITSGHMLRHIPELMDEGSPVSVLFREEAGDCSSLLFCEMIQRARYGDSFIIEKQGCSVGAYVLGEIETAPLDYYHSSGRYMDREAAGRAAASLCRLSRRPTSIKIAPYSGDDFDVLVLFLKPDKAMRLVQAFTYQDGRFPELRTGGIASICSDCTAYPANGRLGLSLGCKGSRKHSKYRDEELPVGIPFQFAERIESALGKIPAIMA
ncbi:MAG TPA: DUF169 domain-containing protein [Candidatus Methanoperedens sp.]